MGCKELCWNTETLEEGAEESRDLSSDGVVTRLEDKVEMHHWLDAEQGTF